MDKANIKHIRAASEIKNDIMDIQNQEDDFGAQANSNIKKRGHSLGNTNQQIKSKQAHSFDQNNSMKGSQNYT